MMLRVIVGMLLAASAAFGQDFSGLPAWAQEAAKEGSKAPVPDADAWVILNRTELTYLGDGKIRTHRQRLVRILSDQGLGEADYHLHGLGGKTSQIKSLNGWNLRPDGEVTKLRDDAILTLGALDPEEVSQRTVSLARLPKAMKGSWIAFESEVVVRYPTGPTDLFRLQEEHPVHRWELAVVKKTGWFGGPKPWTFSIFPQNFGALAGPAPVISGERVAVRDLQALLPEARNGSDGLDQEPWVLIRFQDPGLEGLPSAESWDQLALWVLRLDLEQASSKPAMGIEAGDPRSKLAAVHAWMTREMAYRQVYLTPERGWVPGQVLDVLRRRYGDCKDLAACAISELRHLGLPAYPVLVHRGPGKVLPGGPSYPWAFNHVMVAVKLEASLGLAAEVTTAAGRYYLWDPTDRLGAFGWLPADHRDQDVLLCTEAGGTWVRIPVAAVQRPWTHIRVSAEAGLDGSMGATVEIQEEADALGLRMGLLEGGSRNLKETLLKGSFGVPPSGSLELLHVGDPFVTGAPFKVSFRISQPDGYQANGQEAQMRFWGLPHQEPLFQKAGVSRRTPVRIPGFSDLTWEMEVRVPGVLHPKLPTFQYESPFRAMEWKAEGHKAGDHTQVRMVFKQVLKDAQFELPAQEKGVTEWKKDRMAVRNFLMDSSLMSLGLPTDVF